MNIYEWLEKHDVKISRHQLIDDAFTHTSYVNEHKQALHDNERLEYMGDAVMQIWVSEQLFNHEPVLSEGQMSKYRAAIVCEKSFASLMRKMQLGKYIRLGVGEEKNGGRDRDSILADTFEAFIGALYLCSGMENVDRSRTSARPSSTGCLMKAAHPTIRSLRSVPIWMRFFWEEEPDTPRRKLNSGRPEKR